MEEKKERLGYRESEKSKLKKMSETKIINENQRKRNEKEKRNEDFCLERKGEG